MSSKSLLIKIICDHIVQASMVCASSNDGRRIGVFGSRVGGSFCRYTGSVRIIDYNGSPFFVVVVVVVVVLSSTLSLHQLVVFRLQEGKN